MKEDKRKKFLEFLNVMKGTNQSWNDDVARIAPKDGEEETDKKGKKGKKNNSKMEVEEEQGKKFLT